MNLEHTAIKHINDTMYGLLRHTAVTYEKRIKANPLNLVSYNAECEALEIDRQRLVSYVTQPIKDQSTESLWNYYDHWFIDLSAKGLIPPTDMCEEDLPF